MCFGFVESFMKSAYSKPILVKRELISRVAAGAGTSGPTNGQGNAEE
jgi:hypothetical protein